MPLCSDEEIKDRSESEQVNIMRGKILSGLGQAQYFLSREGYSRQFQERLGFGTTIQLSATLIQLQIFAMYNHHTTKTTRFSVFTRHALKLCHFERIMVDNASC
jgi:hypothetical protein